MSTDNGNNVGRINVSHEIPGRIDTSEYSKAEMDGDFVKTLKGETGTGFAKDFHVHKDWIAKCLPKEKLLEQIEDEKKHRMDMKIKVRNIVPKVDAKGRCVLELQGKTKSMQFFPTDHALNQMGQKLGTSTWELRNLRTDTEDFARDQGDAQTAVALLQNSLRRIDPEKLLFLRGYDDGTLRAFLSEQYAPVDNRWYIEQIFSMIPGGLASHWKGDADTIYGNVLIPDSIREDSDGDYGAMISLSNCEIGTRGISQRPSVFRAICLNGCIWSQAKGMEINRRHRGQIDLVELAAQIRTNLEAQIPLLPQGIQRLLGTKAYGEGTKFSVKGAIAEVANEFKLPPPQAYAVLDEWAKNESVHRNGFGIINAITRAGQTFDRSEWVKFDEIGGKLLGQKPTDWADIFTAGNKYNEEQLTATFYGKLGKKAARQVNMSLLQTVA